MTASVIGALRVNLSADTAEFKRGLSDAEKTAEKFGRMIGSTLRSGVLALGAGLAAAAAGLVALTKSSIETISAQVDLANRVGASVAAIQTLQYAAKLSGASNEALAKTLGTLNARLGEAAREGAGPAHEALQRLGLSARELSQMDADERIKTLSDRMKELNLSTQAQADTLRSLGVRQQEIINLFQEGSGAIDDARAELQSWGVLLSDVDASKVEAAGDAWDKMMTIMSGVGNQIAVRISPIIQEIADYLGEAAKESGGFGSAIDTAVSFAIKLFGELNMQVYRFRVELDEAIGDTLDLFDNLAGAAPNLIAKMFGGTAEDYGFKPVNESFGRLREALEKPPSQEEWDAWLMEIRSKADAAAAASLAASKGKRAGGLGDGDTEAEQKLAQRRADEMARYQEQLAQRLAALKESLITEGEAELAAYEQRLLNLKDFHAKGMLSDQEYQDLLIKNKQDYAAKVQALDEEVARTNERNAERQRRAYFQIADDIGSALNSLFGENKAVAMAMAVINTAQAVTRTLAEYGATPIGLAAAAAAAAAGAAEIATIASTSKSGGGSKGGGRSSGAGAPAAGAPAASGGGSAGPQQSVFINLQGQNFGADQVRGLVEQINEYVKDGGRLVVSSAV